jgi:hypothetical protein
MFIIKFFHLKDENALTKGHLNHYNSISNPIICNQMDIWESCLLQYSIIA